MGWNDLKVDFDRNFNRTGMGWNELEWVGMVSIQLEWIGMGWNDLE